MTQPVVIATLERNAREGLRVALDTWRGAHSIDLRIIANLTGSSGIKTPGKGVSLDLAQLPALRQALAEAEDRARDLGWLQETGHL